jgi:hypothetical protein
LRSVLIWSTTERTALKLVDPHVVKFVSLLGEDGIIGLPIAAGSEDDERAGAQRAGTSRSVVDFGIPRAAIRQNRALIGRGTGLIRLGPKCRRLRLQHREDHGLLSSKAGTGDGPWLR